jgi:hypothetical protein
MSFPTVYEIMPISRDPGKSRERKFPFPISREIEFPGKWVIRTGKHTSYEESNPSQQLFIVIPLFFPHYTGA